MGSDSAFGDRRDRGVAVFVSDFHSDDVTSVIADWPPNIEAIRAVLPVTEGNIFAYDHTIYNPGNGYLGPELMAHEEVHFGQQDDIGVEVWWQRFLDDPEFRLEQEIPAHKAEYDQFCRLNKDRNHRSRFLTILSKRLAAPMYGGIITASQARRRIG